MTTAAKEGLDVRKQFEQAGFEVASGNDPAGFEVKKNNCSRSFSRGAGGEWRPSGPPHFIVRGLKCELEDHGYQKFWYYQGKRFPIRQEELKALHNFDEEIRALLHLKTLYHESLGTTSARSVYDRLEGRPDKV